MRSLTWDTGARTATVELTSDIDQDITFVRRRGISSVSTTASVQASSLGNHARVVTLTAGAAARTLLPDYDGSFRLSNVNSGKVLDSPGSSTTAGTALDQWSDTDTANQWWKLVPASTSGHHRLVDVRNGLCAGVRGSSVDNGAKIVQWPSAAGHSQEWQLVGV
ncbi:RICIN domain-containing protein [Streptomyces sp. NPDC057438]|uniref:RICIN domain-containing protein n=1 Tax=Streptomyces sp. NPDC057438 TaxID=3346133 RepID=UPI0036AB8CBA